MKTVAFIACLLVTNLFASGTPVVPETFFQAHQGLYKIALVAGEKPKEGNSLGKVKAEKDMGMLELAYCTSTFCDPGYLDFPHADTQVFAREEGGVTIYTLLLNEQDNVSKFEWEESSPIRFRNYQYGFSQGVGTLEHLIERM